MKRPHIKEINGAKVLMVEGKPFIMLAGEVRKKYDVPTLLKMQLYAYN